MLGFFGQWAMVHVPFEGVRKTSHLANPVDHLLTPCWLFNLFNETLHRYCWFHHYMFMVFHLVYCLKKHRLDSKSYETTSGWWFGTCFIFHILGIIIDPNWLSLIFFRGVGRYTTNQTWIHLTSWCFFVALPYDWNHDWNHMMSSFIIWNHKTWIHLNSWCFLVAMSSIMVLSPCEATERPRIRPRTARGSSRHSCRSCQCRNSSSAPRCQ